MEELAGGREGQIKRKDDRVYRPAGAWTASVQALLRHIREQGFTRAPIPYGVTDDGQEIVSFLDGDVCNYPLSDAAKSDYALISAAQLLRVYHDATVSFIAEGLDKYHWQLPSRDPIEVICHGDFAPYNVVLDGETAVGIIDFDTAHPAPRSWDIAYALYRWAPLTDPQNEDGFGSIDEQIRRTRLFCDAYGLSLAEREQLPQQIIDRLQALLDFMHGQAAAGDETFAGHIAEGHHLLYQNDIAYIQQHLEPVTLGLFDKRM